jgi:hypothetical protein
MNKSSLPPTILALGIALGSSTSHAQAIQYVQQHYPQVQQYYQQAYQHAQPYIPARHLGRMHVYTTPPTFQNYQSDHYQFKRKRPVLTALQIFYAQDQAALAA